MCSCNSLYLIKSFYPENLHLTESKSCPTTPCRRQGGEEAQFLLILDLSTRRVSGRRYAPAALCPCKGLRCPSDRGLGGTQSRSKQTLEETSFASVGDRTPVTQTVVKTLYWLSYPSSLHFEEGCMCGTCTQVGNEINIVIYFQILLIKENKRAYRNKSVNNFMGLVTSGLGPDVAHEPSPLPCCTNSGEQETFFRR
jgi:hypothetical protein